MKANENVERILEIAKINLLEKPLKAMTTEELSFLALMEINDTLADIHSALTTEVNGEK